MNKQLLLFCLVIIGFFSNLNAQEKDKCYANIKRAERIKNNPSLKSEIEKKESFLQNYLNTHKSEKRTEVVIPVVVHVLYFKPEENISDEQIQSQITVLNEDFGFYNSNKLASNHPFYKYCGNSGIQFKLANTDPNGNSTTGITRTEVTKEFWKESELDDVKFPAFGGVKNWDPNSYLNIWVINIDDSSDVLGYATFPYDLSSYPEYDGFIVRHQAFGTVGTAGADKYPEANLGRTSTHEIGHWLNLFHIWGDTLCGDDLVADTEPADSANHNCPTFPHKAKNTCGSSENGEMYMNYMDYTSDACMSMFTVGQVERMNASITNYRSAILKSIGYQTASIAENEFKSSFQISPNPSSGIFNLFTHNNQLLDSEIRLIDLLGNPVMSFQNTLNNTTELNCEGLPNGLYFLQIQKNSIVYSTKIIINK